jgi:hypothetical protein
VGSSLRYQQLIDVGHAFIAAIGPIKAAFVARAFPADFDEKLAEQIAAFETATQQKIRGRQQRRGGTAGLKLTMKKVREAINELDAILSVHYRATNPTLLEVWKLARRVQRPAYNTGPKPIIPAMSGTAEETTSHTLVVTKGPEPANESGMANANPDPDRDAQGEATLRDQKHSSESVASSD